MAEQGDRNLALIESELRFIARHAQTIEGSGGSDYERIDELGLAVESALRALFEYKLSIQPDATEEIPEGVSLPEAA